MLVATRLPLTDWAPVRRKQPPNESLFGPPLQRAASAEGLPSDFDHASYRCSVTSSRRQHGEMMMFHQYLSLAIPLYAHDAHTPVQALPLLVGASFLMAGGLDGHRHPPARSSTPASTCHAP